MKRLLLTMVATVLGVGGLPAVPAGPAYAVQTPQSQVVTDDPANFTPHVLDGQVNAIAQVGNRILLGGSFTQARAANDTTVLARRNMLAFDATTGAISTAFRPEPDGAVTAILPSGDGTTVYIGGDFNTVGGGPSATLARIDATTGARVSGFRPPSFDGRIRDLKLAGGRLWLAGLFGTVAGRARAALATVNPATGAFDPYMGLAVAGTHNGGTTAVLKMDVDPAGTRLVAIGNFTTVGGTARHQIAVLDLTGASAALANWQTTFYTSTCASVFNTYMRDLDISPDGRYFVVSTTGAYRAPPASCDTTARFELGATGTGITPTWVDYTGGDTTYAVAITGTVVYTGGHARWQNNPTGNNVAGAGAVSRPGIAALDPVNGLPLAWNPTRARGVGVFDMLATSTGLWVASDTDRIGATNEFHGRIAYFPLAGGTTIPPNDAPTLPGTVYLAGPRTTGPLPATSNTVSRRSFDGAVAGAATAVPAGGRTWGNLRGAFMLHGQLYTAWSDGTFTRQSFNGTTFGTAFPVDTSDLLTPLADWHTDAANATGMFFHGGRIYFTRAGQTGLYYRYFTPSSGVVGATRFLASSGVAGIGFATVEGMFLAGSRLYWSSSDGLLRRIDFVGGTPVAGTGAVLSTPGVNWRARALFLGQDAPAPPPNQPPTAVATVSCSAMTCSASGAGSSDADGTIAAYAWDFGDGGTASGVSATHTYGVPGTYTVTLRVTDNGGATGETTRSVTVDTAAPAGSFVAAARTNANVATFTLTVPSAVAAGDTMLLFFTGSLVAPTLSEPSGTGWTSAGSGAGADITGRAWSKVATAADAGQAVTVTSSAQQKGDLTLLVYRGMSATDPVAASAMATETVSRTTHTTPVVTVPAGGGWLVSYWSDKSGTTTVMAAPAGVTSRGSSTGAGAGHVTVLAGDSAGTVPAGAAGGLPATADAASAKAMMGSIVLRPA